MWADMEGRLQQISVADLGRDLDIDSMGKKEKKESVGSLPGLLTNLSCGLLELSTCWSCGLGYNDMLEEGSKKWKICGIFRRWEQG